MRVACHFTVPEPVDLRLDAAAQDGLRIVEEIGGEINFLYPGKTVKRYFPRFLSGFQQLSKLRKIDARVDVHHVFSNGFYPYPIYTLLHKPIVVSTMIGVQKKMLTNHPFLCRYVKQFIVPTEQDRQIMGRYGHKNVSVVKPGIAVNNFSYTPCLDSSKFVLLAGSAPWTKLQFTTKGVDQLLSVMLEIPWLHIVFLWRGVLRDIMEQKVLNAGLENRVRIIDGYVDVNKLLAEVHAAIVLASDQDVIKSHPHSIMEALAARKPIILSGCLPIGKFVEEKKCGEVLHDFDKDNLKNALNKLKSNYQTYCAKLQEISLEEFSYVTMIQKNKELYSRILGKNI